MGRWLNGWMNEWLLFFTAVIGMPRWVSSNHLIVGLLVLESPLEFQRCQSGSTFLFLDLRVHVEWWEKWQRRQYHVTFQYKICMNLNKIVWKLSKLAKSQIFVLVRYSSCNTLEEKQDVFNIVFFLIIIILASIFKMMNYYFYWRISISHLLL